MHVRFQPKAWFDEEECEDYALREIKEITAEARKAGRESVAIFDNLWGQTTERHKKNLWKWRCKRHLLPAGVTDMLQLIDDGVGYALKNEMGHLLDEWLGEASNLEMWTGDSFPMWRKRVLLTQLAAKAWENICERFDFEGSATRLGMLMTVDGSGDDLIKLRGCETYTFTNADGGAAAAGSDDEDAGLADEGADPDDEADELADVDDQSDDEDDEVEDGDESDEEDDTAEDGTVATVVGDAVAPAGYSIVAACPPLVEQADRQALIGKKILYGWDNEKVQGWFAGTVQGGKPSTTDLKVNPTANAVVKYKSSETDKALNGSVACELSARLYGANQWWVLLEKL